MCKTLKLSEDSSPLISVKVSISSRSEVDDFCPPKKDRLQAMRPWASASKACHNFSNIESYSASRFLPVHDSVTNMPEDLRWANQPLQQERGAATSVVGKKGRSERWWIRVDISSPILKVARLLAYNPSMIVSQTYLMIRAEQLRRYSKKEETMIAMICPLF